MADGSDYLAPARCAITATVMLAMAERMTFNQLRHLVCAAVKTEGGRMIATDRNGGRICVVYATADNVRRELLVPETEKYQEQVPLSTW